MINPLIILILIVAITPVHAQLVFINTQVSIMSGTPVSSIGGGVIVENQGELFSDGEFHIHGDFVNTNETTALESSLFVVKGNWVNDSAFYAIGGEVKLDSLNQLITGTHESHFYKLTLVNGIKTQTLNASSFELEIESTHLATSVHTFEVVSSEPDALQSDGSWVSSEEEGRLIRATNSTNNYLFPVGSELYENRYSPVVVEPLDDSINKVGIRFVNHDATVDGYNIFEREEEIIMVNNLYYHLIEHNEGTSGFDITFVYNSSEIEAECVGHWNLNEWQNQFNTAGGNNSGNITALNVSDFTTEAFVLVDLQSAVFVPNAFTADNDGLNDYFSIYTEEYEDLRDFHLRIFNSWGELVFETNNPMFHWAGGDDFFSGPQVFSWQLTFKDENSSRKEFLNGHITIIR